MKHMFYVQYTISTSPLLSLKVIKQKWLLRYVMLAQAVLDYFCHHSWAAPLNAVCRYHLKFVFEILKSKAKVTEFLCYVYISQFV
jgi:hypothetical protein